MSIFVDTPRPPVHATFAGGEASLSSIMGAAYDALTYVDYGTGSINSLDRAYQERNSRIHGATGAMLPHPLRQAEEEIRRRERELPTDPSGQHPDETFYDILERYQRAYDTSISELAEKFPDAGEAIGAGRSIDEDATAIARRSDKRLAREMQSRPGFGKYAAMLAGGMGAAAWDPVTLVSLMAGGGPGAARTMAGRILTVAGKETLINATAEAALQPAVQAWRERAGLDHGMDEAIRNVLFAGALGGVFGSGLGAAGELASRMLRPADIDRAAAHLAASGRLTDSARSIVEGDGLRAAESLAEIRHALAPEARGALDAAESMRLADEARPVKARPDGHELRLADADRVVKLPAYAEAWPGFSPDPVQIERVVRAIAGDMPALPDRAAALPETPLINFLIDRGGVQEFRGELAAIGAGDVVERFRGRLVKDSGDSLDYAREAAAEAGFFNHLYGDAETASARSTVPDLLDVLEEEIRIRTGDAARAEEDAALVGLETAVADIARMAGPEVDDALLERAARMVVEQGDEPFDALERVLIADDLPETARPQRAGEPMPGWSDEYLMSASERRGAWPEADGVDQPGRLAADDVDLGELAEVPDDFLIPTEDGMVSAAVLRDEIARGEDLVKLVEACRA